MANDEHLKSPREWAKVTGIEVLDADGWRGSTGRDFTEAISEDEYRYRASFSTVRQTRPIWTETPQEAFDEAMEKDPEPEPDSDPED